jgi:UDP-glucose 4-epimerase
MLVLVTGGAGAIGSQLVAELHAAGHDVVVVDDLSTGYRENVPADVAFVKASILDRPTMRTVLSDFPFDWIFHLAASFANEASVDNPSHDLAVNGLGTLVVGQQASEFLRYGHLKKLVYVSTSCVYGARRGMLSEAHPTHPATPYAASKLLGEHYLAYFARAHGLPVVVLRLFNCFGPGEYPAARRGVISKFIACALSGQPLVITGTGRESRDFTYVHDAVTALMMAAQSRRKDTRIYNIGTGRATSILELAEAILALTHSGSLLRYKAPRAWDCVVHRQADVGRAKSELGFRASTSLNDGLAKTADWLQSRIVSVTASAPPPGWVSSSAELASSWGPLS